MTCIRGHFILCDEGVRDAKVTKGVSAGVLAADGGTRAILTIAGIGDHHGSESPITFPRNHHMPKRHDDGVPGGEKETERICPERKPPRDGAAESSPPRPAAASILQSVLPRGGWAGGIRLNELPDEPKLPDLKQGADKYTVHGLLGEGGMGKVYLARDEDLHRPVALKMARTADPEHLARFVAEAQVMGQLHHPGIVPVFELGQSRDARPYYAMPVVRGETLHDVIEALAAGKPEAVQRWSLTRRMQIFLQVCQAVAYAHEKGVLHRDLKPANVMVGRHGEVQVLDWGLSKVVRKGGIELDRAPARPAGTGFVEGTPAYMSPEHARGEEPKVRTDVYSMGAILYELLTLKPLFEGGTPEVLAALQRDEPIPPHHAAPRETTPRLSSTPACARFRRRLRCAYRPSWRWAKTCRHGSRRTLKLPLCVGRFELSVKAAGA